MQNESKRSPKRFLAERWYIDRAGNKDCDFLRTETLGEAQTWLGEFSSYEQAISTSRTIYESGKLIEKL